MKIKKYVLPVVAFLILITFLFGFKGGSGFSIEVDDSYAVATKASEVDAVAERLGIQREEAVSYFKQNTLKFIAVSEDTKTQIRISRFSDNFSSSVYDAENLNEQQVGELISIYGSGNQSVDVIESDGRKFAVVTEVLEDSGGVYTSTQYVTIAGGRTYVITCYNQGESTSVEVEKIFSTFTARDMTTRIESYKTRKKWIIPGVVAMCAIVGVSVIGLVIRLYEK